jgi:TPR repeat protein
MLDEGTGVARNRRKAVEWYEKAAEQGVQDAQLRLAVLLDEGKAVRRNRRKAARWYAVLAEAGNADAQSRYAELLWSGDGVTYNRHDAMDWHRKAAEQGNVKSQAFLGNQLLQGGQGIRKNPAEALRWLKLAAAQGDVTSRLSIGRALWNGVGVPQDRAAAIEIFREAVQLGALDALLDLGVAYHYGMEVEKDNEESYYYLALAAKARHPDAAKQLRALEQMMDSEAIARAKQRADADYPPLAAKWRARALGDSE